MRTKLKPSRQAVVDAINTTNRLYDNPLTLEQIGLGMAYDSELPDTDTYLLVYALNNRGYRGTQTVTYNRYVLEQFFANITAVAFGGPVTKLSEALPALNAKYQVDLRAEDIIDVDVSELGEDWTVDVVARPGNVMWRGKFRFRYAKTVPLLSAAIVEPVLNVITAPFTNGTKPRAEYVAYGYDFSEAEVMFDAIGLGTNVTADQIETLNVIANLNFSIEAPGVNLPAGAVSLAGARWTARKVVTETSVYSPYYRKVMVLTLADTSNFAGDLYLHYLPVE